MEIGRPVAIGCPQFVQSCFGGLRLELLVKQPQLFLFLDDFFAVESHLLLLMIGL